MKKTLSLLLLGIVITLSNCTTDFEIAADWKDIPVAYAFINRQDTAHYVRVEKAFLDPDGNATQIAEIADSLYYDDAVVQIQKLASGEVFTLERVDGNLEGYPREEGPFAQSPNYLYKIKSSQIELEGGEQIRLLINRGDDKDLVTAETKVLNDFVPVESSPASPMNIRYTSFVNVSWNVGEFAQIFDIRMVFKYKETDPDNPTQFIDKSVTWVLDDDFEREDPTTNRVRYTFLGEAFYRFIGSAIDDAENSVRVFEEIDLVITGSGQELVDLLRISRANSGITSSQVIPEYTNLSEGLGIFTSRSQVLRSGLQLNSIALDSLREGIFTRDLNFQ